MNILSMMHSRISAALSLTPKEFALFEANPYPLPPSVSIVPYLHPPDKPYPVNRLRNLAIKNVNTSHFFYNDIDFLPSGRVRRILSIENLYEELMKIPESFLGQPYSAIIIPAFEYLPKKKIPGNQLESEFKNYLPFVPTTKEMLNACLLTTTKNCTIFRDKARLHEYLISEWFRGEKMHLYELPCLRGDRQEPYTFLHCLYIAISWFKRQIHYHCTMSGL